MIGLPTDLRNARLDIIRSAIDVGADEYYPAYLEIYSGVRVPTGEELDEYDNAELLLIVDFSYPCAPAVSNGKLTFDTMYPREVLVAGVATWARIRNGDDDFVLDCSVSLVGGSGDVKLSSIELFLGDDVLYVSAELNEGNA